MKANKNLGMKEVANTKAQVQCEEHAKGEGRGCTNFLSCDVEMSFDKAEMKDEFEGSMDKDNNIMSKSLCPYFDVLGGSHKLEESCEGIELIHEIMEVQKDEFVVGTPIATRLKPL